MRGTTFGAAVFETEVTRIEPSSELHFAVVLYAAVCDPDIGVARDELASLIWPEASIESSRHNLRQTLYRLRQLGVPVNMKGGRVVLTELDVEVDVRELIHGAVSREGLLRLATRGFLPGYAPRFGTKFMSWLQDLRDRIDRVRRHALVDALQAARSHATFREVQGFARALLALDPLNETATLLLAEALVMEGSKVEAVRLLEVYEQEVGSVSEAMQVPARKLRQRVSERLDEALLPRRSEVPFVGRSQEFQQLREGLARCRGGVGQYFAVTGEAGIGKTRIAKELLRFAVLDGALHVTYACTSGDALSPLSSLLALSASMLALPGALGCATEHLQHLRRLQLPETDAAELQRTSADIAYAQLVLSLGELTSAVTDEAPLVLFVDDAHRLHQTSWRILSDVVDRCAGKRLLLILAARRLPDWYAQLGIDGSSGRNHHMILKPLSVEDSRLFVTAWRAKDSPMPTEVDYERLVQTAHGNPFYLAELLAQGVTDGAHAAPPAGISALIQMQHLSLTKGAQRALAAAALLERHATIGRVEAVLGFSSADFVGFLDELETSGLVSIQQGHLTVRHALIGEFAISHTPTSVVCYLRNRAATCLEREGLSSQGHELLSDALSHWERAGAGDRAAETAVRLGKCLSDRRMSTEAAASYLRALNLTAAAGVRSRALLGAAQSLAEAYEWHSITALRPELTPEIMSYLQPPQRATLAVVTEQATMWTSLGEPDYETLEEIIEAVDLHPRIRLEAAQLAVIAADNAMRGHEYCAPRQATLEALCANAPSAIERATFGMICALALNQIPQARRTALSLRSSACERPPSERVRLSRLAGHCLLRLGYTHEALEDFQRSLSDARYLRLRTHLVNSLEMLVRCHLQLGDFEAASEALAEIRSNIPGDAKSPRYARATFHFEAMLAMASQDGERASVSRALLERLDDGPLFALERHSELFARAALSFAFPELVTIDSESWLRTLDKRVLTRGAVDYSVVALTRALKLVGRTHDAVETVREYFSELRAERTPPSERLWSLAPAEVQSACPHVLRGYATTVARSEL
ncbi:MAG: AAA family ATPase [Gemmatimonadaceae bacterium]|nr:AAA family ATPase [Gemmatimonadaceae bacterium]